MPTESHQSLEVITFHLQILTAYVDLSVSAAVETDVLLEGRRLREARTPSDKPVECTSGQIIAALMFRLLSTDA